MPPELLDFIPQEFVVWIYILVTLYMVKTVRYMILLLGLEMPESINEGAPKLNLDKFGMPQDYASYIWLLYKKTVNDESPNRRAFLNGKSDYFGFTVQYDEQ